jgi:hypothetical protein
LYHHEEEEHTLILGVMTILQGSWTFDSPSHFPGTRIQCPASSEFTASFISTVFDLSEVRTVFNVQMAMDNDYIKRMVGDALAEGLRATTHAHPVDPIIYLATWLLHYRDHQDGCSALTAQCGELRDERVKYLADMEVERQRVMAERAVREAESRRLAEERWLAQEAARRARRRRVEEEDKHEDSGTNPSDTYGSGSYSDSYP